MTKQEAKQLESEADKLFSDALETECTVSMALTRALRVQIGENFINIKVKPQGDYVDWVHWIGDFNDLRCYIDHILIAIQNNREKIDLLMESYVTELDEV